MSVSGAALIAEEEARAYKMLASSIIQKRFPITIEKVPLECRLLMLPYEHTADDVLQAMIRQGLRPATREHARLLILEHKKMFFDGLLQDFPRVSIMNEEAPENFVRVVMVNREGELFDDRLSVFKPFTLQDIHLGIPLGKAVAKSKKTPTQQQPSSAA